MITALESKRWSADQMHFMVWLATPSAIREPKTQAALAEELGTDETRLSKWKALPGFADATYQMAREVIKFSYLVDILEAQAEKAIAGDTTAARFVFEAVGVTGPGATLNLTQINYGDLSAVREKYTQRIQELVLAASAQPTLNPAETSKAQLAELWGRLPPQEPDDREVGHLPQPWNSDA